MGSDILNKKWSVIGAVLILILVVFSLILREFLGDVSGYQFVRVLASLMPLTGYAGIFLFLLLENISLPFPGEFLLPLAGYYVFVGRMSFVSVFAVSLTACVIGSLAIVLLTLKFGAPGVYWIATRIGVNQSTLARNEVRLCRRYGSALISASHFIPFLGSAVLLPAGAVRKNPVSFIGLSLVGSLGSTAGYLLLGYSMSPFLGKFQQLLSQLIVQYVFYAIAAVSFVYITYYCLKSLRYWRTKNRFLKSAAIERSPDTEFTD